MSPDQMSGAQVPSIPSWTGQSVPHPVSLSSHLGMQALTAFPSYGMPSVHPLTTPSSDLSDTGNLAGGPRVSSWPHQSSCHSPELLPPVSCVQPSFHPHLRLPTGPSPQDQVLFRPPVLNNGHESTGVLKQENQNPDPNIIVTLDNDELWNQFSSFGNEMIITKSGRRMFPTLGVKVSGLDPNGYYFILMDMVATDGCRYKFGGQRWLAVGNSEPPPMPRLYLHPDCPALGSHWMKQPVLFSKAKLTNNSSDNQGHIVLHSMHRYQPRIYVVAGSDIMRLSWSFFNTFTFPQTAFMAVTAYQNELITKLKIQNNPFAKGFRESGTTRMLKEARKRGSSTESDDSCEPAGEPECVPGWGQTSSLHHRNCSRVSPPGTDYANYVRDYQSYFLHGLRVVPPFTLYGSSCYQETSQELSIVDNITQELYQAERKFGENPSVPTDTNTDEEELIVC